MKYYDIQKKWTRKIVPHLDDPALQSILVRDFNKYTLGRWGKPFKPGMLPEDVENCDWRWRGASRASGVYYSVGSLDGSLAPHRRGPLPAFWKYVKHAACHSIVNFALALAQKVEPDKPWRIVTSDEHSTVWDGDETLCDFNYLALGIPIDEAWKRARFSKNAKVLRIGEELPTYVSDHFLIEMLNDQDPDDPVPFLDGPKDGPEKVMEYLLPLPMKIRKRYLRSLRRSMEAKVKAGEITVEDANYMLTFVSAAAVGALQKVKAEAVAGVAA